MLKLTMKPHVQKKLIGQLSKYPDWVSNFKAYIQPKDKVYAQISCWAE
jgi:hypothetical protein